VADRLLHHGRVLLDGLHGRALPHGLAEHDLDHVARRARVEPDQGEFPPQPQPLPLPQPQPQPAAAPASARQLRTRDSARPVAHALTSAPFRLSPPLPPAPRLLRQQDNEARGVAWRAASAHHVAADPSKISIFGTFARKTPATVGKALA